MKNQMEKILKFMQWGIIISAFSFIILFLVFFTNLSFTLEDFRFYFIIIVIIAAFFIIGFEILEKIIKVDKYNNREISIEKYEYILTSKKAIQKSKIDLEDKGWISNYEYDTFIYKFIEDDIFLKDKDKLETIKKRLIND